MPSYEISYGASVRAYANAELDADTVQLAIAEAKLRFAELWKTADVEHVVYVRPVRPTVVHVTEMGTGKSYPVGEDFGASDEDRMESAASDLLASLIRVTADYRSLRQTYFSAPGMPNDGGCEAIEEAEKAIAKATGGAA
jgi:hypothetical protein